MLVGGGIRYSSCANPSFGEESLIREFVEHYRTERFHQGIGGELIKSQPGSANDNAARGLIACRAGHSGLLNYCQREAA
jgi:hypothetical protein